MTKPPQSSTAYHEAGHAVVGLVRGLNVHHLSIIENIDLGEAGFAKVKADWRGDALAHGEGAALDDEDLAYAYRWVEGRVLNCLAGATAQQMWTGCWSMEGAQDDMYRMSEELGQTVLRPLPHNRKRRDPSVRAALPDRGNPGGDRRPMLGPLG